MKRHLYTLVALTLLLVMALTGPASGTDRWEAPFAVDSTVGDEDSTLTLQAVLHLVAARNPLLPSLLFRLEAANGGIIQAGIKPSPELESEIGNVGWDAPGTSEAEISVSLSQEFELFGKRGARKRVAEVEQQEVEFEAQVDAFDLYLDTRGRYYRLAHAQEQYHLSEISVELADDIVATIRQRIDKGVALQSELLLARLELKRAKLARADAAMDIETARIELTSLWASDFAGVSVVALAELDYGSILNRVSETLADSTRELLALDRYQERLKAERQLAVAEARPNLTLSGGVKRVTADGSKSLMFGLALPLPFGNQNRGTLRSLDADIQRIDFERQQARLLSTTAVASGVARLRQLTHRHVALHDELLPTAEEAYQTIQMLYQSGRLPYTSLLEANRSLVELRFEHNDMMLALREQIITLERLGGVILQADEDSDND